MSDIQLGAVEARFADMIWERAPVTAAELARLGAAELGWKKTTAYTVLHRLCEKGLFRLEDGVVTARLGREGLYAAASRQFVDERFSGSLPAFLAAFTRGRALSERERDELRRMIEEA